MKRRQRKTTQWERNKHLFKRLIDNPEFQKRVLAFRKKWDIPVNGYEEAGPQQSEKIGKLDDEYYEKQWASDQKLWKESEKKALALEITWQEYEDIKKKIHYNRPINAYFHDIDLIIEDLKVSPTWRNNIEQYILLNTLDSMRMAVGISFTMPHKDFPDTIKITIDAHTTLQDLIERWPDIEREQKRLRHSAYEKYQPYPSYDLHKKLYELRQSGKSLKTISEETNVPYNYINIYINRYLEHINRK